MVGAGVCFCRWGEEGQRGGVEVEGEEDGGEGEGWGEWEEEDVGGGLSGAEEVRGGPLERWVGVMGWLRAGLVVSGFGLVSFVMCWMVF